MVAVDLGYRLRPDGSMRIAYWVGDDDECGEICLSEKFLGRFTVSPALDNTIDVSANTMHLELKNWIKENTVSDEIREATETISQWKGIPWRLFKLWMSWKENRFDGDEQIFGALNQWRKQFVHLDQWRVGNDKRSVRQRKDLIGKALAELRRKYKTAIIEDIDWRQLSRTPLIEEGDAEKALRKLKRIASPSVTESLIKNGFAETVLVDPKKISATCFACGKESKTEDSANLMHTCRNCQETYDQDKNACLNLLRFAKTGVRPVAT
jgi:transposase